MFKIGFSVHNIHLYLCEQVENTKWILRSQKIGVKWVVFKTSNVQIRNFCFLEKKSDNYLFYIRNFETHF